MLPATLGSRRSSQWKRAGVPRIDWSHPLARGLLFYGYDTGFGGIVDLVSGRGMKAVGTLPSVGASPNGQGFLWNNSPAAYFSSDSTVQIGGPYTVACAYIQTGTVGAYTRPFGRTALNGGSQPFVNWDFEINDASTGQNKVTFNYDDGGVVTTAATWSGNANNVFTSLLMSAFDAVSKNINCYAQGALVASHTYFNCSTSNTNDAILFSGASAAASVSPFIGYVYYGAFWNRPLSAAEALRLHADPYCFLIYPHDLAFAALAAPAGGNRTITGASTVPAFTESAALAVTDKITGASSVPAFASTAHLTYTDRITGAETMANFTSSGAIAQSDHVTAAQTIAAFTNSGALKAIDKIAGASTVPAFTESAAMKAIDKIAANDNMPAFTSTAHLTYTDRITGASAMPTFASIGEISTGAPAPSGLYPYVRRRGRIGRA